MTNAIFSRCPAFFAILLLAGGLVVRSHAQPVSTTMLLENAYATLGAAKHDYKGHRVKAMKQIEAAFNESGWKIKGLGKNFEPQGTSDEQLRSAENFLRQAGPGLSSRALKHVNDAIAQINDALAIK